MTTKTEIQNEYVSRFHQLEDKLASGGPQWVQTLRQNALDQFIQLGFPTARKGNEQWKYTNIAPIARESFDFQDESSFTNLGQLKLDQYVHRLNNQPSLVFVNGIYCNTLSSPLSLHNGVRIVSMADTGAYDDTIIENHLGKYAQISKDGFTALNTAFLKHGALVYVPNDAVIKDPINIVFFSTDEGRPQVSFPRILIMAGARSRMKVIESFVGVASSHYFTNAVSEIVIEDEANVDHYRILSESPNAFHVGTQRVYQKHASIFNSHTFQKGPALGRYDLNVELAGQETHCDLKGLYMTSGDQHMDNLINIDHTEPNGTSRLYYKGILDQKSKAVFGGTVIVRREAQKTDSLQSDKNLLLSPDAEMYSKPALFIYADDVKCGHGATAGNIDYDTVFYMKSRGLDPETASRLLIYGFASEIIDTVRLEELRTHLEELFLESLPTHIFEF